MSKHIRKPSATCRQRGPDPSYLAWLKKLPAEDQEKIRAQQTARLTSKGARRW